MNAQPMLEQSQGFRIAGLRNADLEIRIIPALGAKICSLIHRPSGREWMWRPTESLQLFPNRTGDPFADGTKIGADECLPTVEACPWRGRALTDHGEAWTEKWLLNESALAEGFLKTRLVLPISPLVITRAISLDGAAVNMDYTLTNTGTEPCEFVWALHPMMTLKDGDELFISRACKTVQIELTMDCPLGERGTVLSWPSPAAGIAFDKLDLDGPNRAIKLFTPPHVHPWAALCNRETGEYIVYSSASDLINTIGIWINQGAWNGYRHVALEPTCGAPDSLARAVTDWKRFACLAPGEQARWQVKLSLGIRPQGGADYFHDMMDTLETIHEKELRS